KGLNLYENGRYHQAIIVWENVLNNSSKIQEKILTLNYLSNGYQELGEWEKAESALDESLKLLQSQSNPSILAQVLTTQGNLQLATGQTEAALNTWQKAENIYKQINDKTGILGSKINQAQALQSLGLYRNAKEILADVNQELQKEPDSEIKAMGLRSLGNILQVIGDLNYSQKVLEQSLLISQKIKSNSDITGTLFSLGNTFRDLQNYPQAETYYQKALVNTKDALTRLQIQNNQLSLLLTDENPEQAVKLINSMTEEIHNITPSRMSIYALINFSENLLKIKSISSRKIGDILGKAVQYSQILNDRKAEAYSVGQLGKLYLHNQQLETSQELTIKALKIAQQIRS
ncbi:MAG TPA: tetratricopeptide repeat protein, partial [Allocoleopsis sp.]